MNSHKKRPVYVLQIHLTGINAGTTGLIISSAHIFPALNPDHQVTPTSLLKIIFSLKKAIVLSQMLYFR